MGFTLINLDSSELLSARINWTDGKKAARAARLLSIKAGKRYQVRKVDDAPTLNWREREENRFSTGEYKALLPYIHALSREVFPDHYAHIAKKRPSLIAYTKDELKGAADKQSLISVEGYLQLLVDKGFMSSDVKAHYAAQHLSHAKAHEGQLKFATTPDEIERVYINYDRNIHALSVSCMRHDLSHWPRVDGKRFHPTRVYGAGDLAIAYIADDDGNTLARALCWPEKKIYSRVYAGDNSPLHDLLKAEGYSKSKYYDYSNTSISGARLLRIENDNGNLVAPYLDEIGAADDDGEYLILDHSGALNLTETSGETDSVSRVMCEYCEDSVAEGDSTPVYTEISSRGHAQGQQLWCEHCAINNSFYCQGLNERFSDDVGYAEVDGELYSDHYIENNANYCERREEHTFGDMVEVIINERGDTQYWSQGAADDVIGYDGAYYSEDIDFSEVIIERYVAVISHRGYWPRIAINAWFADLVAKIPQYIIDDCEIETYRGVDGNIYLVDYIDNYPPGRERIAPECSDNVEQLETTLAA